MFQCVYLEAVTGQQLQIRQMVDDLIVNLFTVQSIQPLEHTHTESVLQYYTQYYYRQYYTVYIQPVMCSVLPVCCLVDPENFQVGTKQSLHWSPEIQQKDQRLILVQILKTKKQFRAADGRNKMSTSAALQMIL